MSTPFISASSSREAVSLDHGTVFLDFAKVTVNFGDVAVLVSASSAANAERNARLEDPKDSVFILSRKTPPFMRVSDTAFIIADGPQM